MPYRLISFLAVHKALLAGLSVGVYFYIEVATGVIGRTWLVQVLLVIVAVRKVDV